MNRTLTILLAACLSAVSVSAQQRFAPPKVTTLTGLNGNLGDIVNLVGTGDYECKSTTCTSASDWKVITSGVVAMGDVVGPGSATADHMALFNGTTGKLIKDGPLPVGSASSTQVLFDSAGSVGGFGSWDGTTLGLSGSEAVAVRANRPSAMTGVSVSAGNTGSLAAGTYYVVVTYRTTTGAESVTSAEVSATVPIEDDGAGSLLVDADQVVGAFGYNIYVGTSAGTENLLIQGYDFSSSADLSSLGDISQVPPTTATYVTAAVSAAGIQAATLYAPSVGPLFSTYGSNVIGLAPTDPLTANVSLVVSGVSIGLAIYAGNGDDSVGHPSGGGLVIGAGSADQRLVAGDGDGGDLILYGGDPHGAGHGGAVVFARSGSTKAYSASNYSMTSDSIAAFWTTDLAANPATHAYYSWGNSRGVGRCKEDATFNSVGQVICGVYNPQFTKYTPGLANYERIIYGQWNGNVAEIGAEKGGSGTLRKVRLIGANLEIKSTLTPAVTNTSANSCGTTAATIAGNDNVFKVTVGATSGTSCTVTFATAFANAPSCTVSNETTANLARTTSTISAVVLAGVFVAGDVLAGSCLGR